MKSCPEVVYTGDKKHSLEESLQRQTKRIKEAARFQEAIQACHGLNLLISGIDQQAKQMGVAHPFYSFLSAQTTTNTSTSTSTNTITASSSSSFSSPSAPSTAPSSSTAPSTVPSPGSSPLPIRGEVIEEDYKKRMMSSQKIQKQIEEVVQQEEEKEEEEEERDTTPTPTSTPTTTPTTTPSITRTRMSVLDLIQDTPTPPLPTTTTSIITSSSPVASENEENYNEEEEEEEEEESKNSSQYEDKEADSSNLLHEPIIYPEQLNSNDIQYVHINSYNGYGNNSYIHNENSNNIVFYYPCAAQKSYGSEKRFLCPPPVVYLNGKKPSSPYDSLSVLVNIDNTEMVHKSILDENNKASFKQIHVSSSSKLFQLRLNVEMEKNSVITMDSPPITIISKPSTKTTKSRNVSLGINSGDMVCLFNRVNSQTVRTKYMGVDKKKFVAKGSIWSPFVIKCATKEIGIPITYGMEVVLIDVETGFSSDVMIVRKVVKNTLTENAVGAVTQLQKIGLQPKSKPDSFLSILPSCAYGIHNTLLCYHQPSTPKSNIIQDYMCWTIVRIEKSECKLDGTKENQVVTSKPKNSYIFV